MTKTTIRVAVAAASAVIGGAAPARADVIADEPFAYATGPTVNGQGGGTGWSGAWITGQPAFFVGAAAIAGGPSIGQSGGAMRVAGSGRIFRAIDTAPGSPAAVAGLVQSHTAMFFGTVNGIGAPGTTVWVGVLVTGGSGNSGDETQYHLYDGARTDATSLGMGDSNKDGETVAMLRGGNVAQWGFERTCGHSTCVGTTAGGFFATNPSVLFGGTHWSVTRFVFGAASTQITMWRDPAPGTTPPDDASALVLTPFGGGTAAQVITVPALFFNTIAPNASGDYGYAVDEIRITTTFAELSGGGTSPIDAGVTIDAAGSPDGGGTPDGGASLDAGTGGTPGGGCGCRTPGGAGGGRGTTALCLVLAAGALRRRRRHPPR